jgi:hypothetical protein
MKTIAIRVSDADHKLFSDLAARELMPLSVLVRRLVHGHAVATGLVLDPLVESKRALRADAQQVAELVSTTPAYGLNDDGTVNHRLRVAKARTLAKEGMTKLQVAKVMGLTPEQIEMACIEAAKAGVSGALPWHSSEKVFALERMQLDPSYPVPQDA